MAFSSGCWNNVSGLNAFVFLDDSYPKMVFSVGLVDFFFCTGCIVYGGLVGFC